MGARTDSALTLPPVAGDVDSVPAAHAHGGTAKNAQAGVLEVRGMMPTGRVRVMEMSP